MQKYVYRLLCGCFIICCASLLFAEKLVSQKDKNMQGTLQQPLDAEQSLVLENKSDAILASNTPSSGSLLIQLIFALVVICAIIYGVLFVIKRSKQFTGERDPFLRLTASLPLAPDKTVYVVTLTNKAYILGASSNSLSLIANIEDKELIDAMNLYAEQNTLQKKDFNTLLYTFFPSAKPKTNEISLDSFLAKQRERLHNTGKTIHTDAEEYTT